MADKTLNTRQTRNKKEQIEKPTFVKRVVWVVLVGVVPILATTVLVGAALQIIGFPVWQTTLNVIGAEKGTSPVSEALQTTKQDLATATAKERLDSSQIDDLRQQVRSDQQQIAALMTQINQLQSKQNTLQTAQNQAKQEAKVLVQMDPAEAANLLTQMQADEAAATVAAMAPSDSGAILGQMSPGAASKILAMAAKVQSAAVPAQPTDNSTNQG